VLGALSSLVSKSLVAADVTVSPTRYRLWEPVRAYVRDHDPDPAATRRAHAAAVREAALRAAGQLSGPRSRHAMVVLDRELPNIRVGLQHDLAHEPAQALRTFGAMEWFWYRCGMVTEGVALAERILAAAPDADPIDRARVWAARTTLSYLGGDVERSLESLANALALVEGSDHPFRGQVLYYAAVADVVLGDPAAGQRHAAEAAEIGARAGDPVLESVGRMSLGVAQIAAGDQAAGEASLAAAKALGRRGGHLWNVASCDLALARALVSYDPPQPTGPPTPWGRHWSCSPSRPMPATS
jgi:hypothetical protein